MRITDESPDRMEIPLEIDPDPLTYLLPLTAFGVSIITLFILFDPIYGIELKLWMLVFTAAAIAAAIRIPDFNQDQGQLIFDRSEDTITMTLPGNTPRETRPLSGFQKFTHEKYKVGGTDGDIAEYYYRIYMLFDDDLPLMITSDHLRPPDKDLTLQRILAWRDAGARIGQLRYHSAEKVGPEPVVALRAHAVPSTVTDLNVTLGSKHDPKLLIGGLIVGLSMLVYGLWSFSGVVALAGLLIVVAIGVILSLWEVVEVIGDARRRELRVIRRRLQRRTSTCYPVERILGVRKVGRDVVLLFTANDPVQITKSTYLTPAQDGEVEAIHRWMETPND